MSQVPYGYCHCGCGQKTNICTHTHNKRGSKKGEPSRFLPGHNCIFKGGEDHYNWKSGRQADKRGYIEIAGTKGKREHVLVAERVLGKPLPLRAAVHHINNDKSDNRPENLVICQDQAYHNLLHRREIAIRECGHASWRKCYFCHTYDDPKNLTFRVNGGCLHKSCEAKYARDARKRKKNK